MFVAAGPQLLVLELAERVHVCATLTFRLPPNVPWVSEASRPDDQSAFVRQGELASVQFWPEAFAMENKLYLNPFIDVHARVQAFKQRLLEANKDDAAVRNQRILQAAKEAFDKKAN
jgi:hypothetical protein